MKKQNEPIMKVLIKLTGMNGRPVLVSRLYMLAAEPGLFTPPTGRVPLDCTCIRMHGSLTVCVKETVAELDAELKKEAER